MIYVNQQQLDHIRYLVEQSAQGNHILFDPETVKRVSKQNRSDLEKDRTEVAEKLLEQIILCTTIEQKKLFISNLDRKTQDDVARVFLKIVANTAQEHQGYSH